MPPCHVFAYNCADTRTRVFIQPAGWINKVWLILQLGSSMLQSRNFYFCLSSRKNTSFDWNWNRCIKIHSWFECQKSQHAFPLFQGVYLQNIWTNNSLPLSCHIISKQRKTWIVQQYVCLILKLQNEAGSNASSIGLKAKLEKDCGSSCSACVCSNDKVAANVKPKSRPGKI